MRLSERPIRSFLLDTNVFVAAVRHPSRETGTLRFLLEVIQNDNLSLVGNEFWVEEMLRYAEEFHSETAALLVEALLGRARMIQVGNNFVSICTKYMPANDPADILHAATCLQERAILITNDKHSNRISDEHIIEVWSITKAIRSGIVTAKAVHHAKD
ncbi:MAG: PIN domain-containing protein [Thermoplasmata archaeon]|nr:PIN domain-containing protein [Candidatus Sysuiplasma jiujiangense]MBX8641279.1 PIN domain-containing protein [Candidatus Sysuiplasma jiujiangense]